MSDDGAQGSAAAASTQNQALAALLFVYKEVRAQPLPWLEGLEHAKRPMHRPTVLTEDEVQHLLARMHGTKWLMGSLLYGAGLRLGERAAVEVRHVERPRALRCPRIGRRLRHLLEHVHEPHDIFSLRLIHRPEQNTSTQRPQSAQRFPDRILCDLSLSLRLRVKDFRPLMAPGYPAKSCVRRRRQPSIP